MDMPGRNVTTSTPYLYGNNGMENDKELSAGAQNFGARLYDNRLGRWMSTDRLSAKFPFWSPYSFGANNPIQTIDIDGNIIVYANPESTETKAVIKKINALRLKSAIFNRLYEDLDNNLNITVHVNIDTKHLEDIGAVGRAALRKEEGEYDVFFKAIDDVSDYYEDQSYNEELFHVAQFMEYNFTFKCYNERTCSRQTPELESEVKVFNYVVMTEAGYEYGLNGFPSYEAPLVMGDQKDPKDIANVAFAVDKTIGPEKIESYKAYLKQFEETTMPASGSKYGGGQRMLTPNTYNRKVPPADIYDRVISSEEQNKIDSTT